MNDKQNYIEVTPSISLIHANQKVLQRVDKALSFKKTIWIRQYGKVRPKIVQESYFYKKKEMTDKGMKFSYYFFSGFLPRVLKIFPKIKIIKKQFYIPVKKKPKLYNIQFRDYQKQAFRKAFFKRNGIIHHPTGTGKGIILLGLASGIIGNVLILCHSIDIVKQIYNDALKDRLEDPFLLAGGEKELNHRHKLVIASINTFKNRISEHDYNFYDAVIVDECHRISNTYAKVLSKINAPIRIGLTATVPTSQDRKMLIEGLIGKVIDTLTPKQAANKKILSIAHVKIIPLKQHIFSKAYKSTTKNYTSIYAANIVHNRARNELIVKSAMELNKKDKSCLILVKNIRHGENIQRIFKENGQNIHFMQGSSKSNTRILAKENLSQKGIKTLIATVIFLTGVNIPSLDCIIFALGDKSEIRTIQAVGRCLRKTTTKEKALIIDFLDQGKYINNHSKNRIRTYKKQGFEVEIVKDIENSGMIF